MSVNFDALRRYAKEYTIPIISLNTEYFLKNYISDHNIKHIIEIGSAIGYSTSVLKSSIDIHHNDGSIFSREISYPHYYQAIHNTKSLNGVSLFLGNFCTYPVDKYLTRHYFDMAFIDGRKSETLDYLKILTPYLQKTSHIIIDDAIKFKGKMRNCYDFLDKHKIHYTVQQLDDDDGILIIPQCEQLLQALSSL